MNKGQKVLAGMLAVVVVVLAMVAFAPRPEEPTVIAASVVVKGTDSTYHAYRFWSDGAIDVTYTHFENSKAPNFIMKFTNTSLNSNCCGIESLVDPNKLNRPDQNESYVDYLFFNHTYQDRCDDLFDVVGIETEFDFFKFEVEHLVLYNISFDDVESTC